MNKDSDILKFRDAINISVVSGDEIIVQDEMFSLKIQNCSKAISCFLDAIKNSGGSEDCLSEIVLANGDNNDLMNFYYYLERFSKLCMISRTLCDKGLKMVTLEPISLGFKWNAERKLDENQKHVMSRFVFSRRDGAKHICESPLSLARLVIIDEKCADFLHFLSSPISLDGLCAKLPSLTKEFIEYFLETLFNSGFVVPVADDGTSVEDKSEALLQWDFHDLLFHSRTRIGRHNYPNGATYPYLKKIEPLPAYKEPMTENGIDLYKPDIETLKSEDFPFTLVLEQRQSVRTYSDRPIKMEQLGEFLYRSFRIKEVIDAPPGEAESYQVGRRTYAGGGACYELEIYPVINKCEGLARGIYHYDPLNHRLHLINDDMFFVETLVRRASMSAAKLCVPEVLFAITAR
ncbi:MAG TPA: hypothetical protein PKK26_04100, partial [Candidatus Wallbacteria bacterium]|nr:hypothetical protein [Candidatus Wallbacteria bacterium]